MKALSSSCLFLSLMSFQLMALPSLTNKCGEKGINLRLPVDSDIVVYDRECETAFIGPPSAGSARIVSAIPSGNLGFCPSVKVLPNITNKLSLSIDYWMAELIKATEEVRVLEKERDAQRAILIEYEEKLTVLEERLVEKETKLPLMWEELKEAQKRLNKCLTINENSAAVCKVQENEVKELKLKHLDYEDNIIAPISDEIFGLKQKAKILKRKLKQIIDNVDANTEVFDRYKKRLYSLKNEAMEQFGSFAALEGITAQVLFESNWKKQIEYAKRHNPYSRLHITALPITKSSVHVDATSPTAQKLNMPSSLIYANVPGFVKSGITEDTLPSGETKIDNLEASTSPINSLFSGVSGKIVLSLIGSCEFTDSNNKLKRDLHFNELSGHISVNTINEYPMLHDRKHKVHFRATRFAEEIEKRTEKGGFFHISSIHEVIKDNFSNDEFNVEFETDSANDEYSEREKYLIEREAKKEIVDRVLKEIGTVYQLAERRPRMPVSAPRSGATLIYEEFECLGWWYCSVGKFVIGVADSIFGRKDAVANFKARNVQRVSYTYSARKPATYSFVTTFKPMN